jgi:hypothetical protein
VADDPDIAMRAARRDNLDGTFEAVEDPDFSALMDFEGSVIVIAAMVAAGHRRLL